jgi:hypothetical protein
LLIWHTEAVTALDPQTGQTYWSVAFPADVAPVRPAITVGTPRQAGDLLFVSSPHHGPLMLKLAADKPGASVVWQGKSNNIGKPDGLHCLMGTPVLKDGHIYGVCAFGELRCLKGDTGERLWETYAPTTGKKTFYGTAFLAPNGFCDESSKCKTVQVDEKPPRKTRDRRDAWIEPRPESRKNRHFWTRERFSGRASRGPSSFSGFFHPPQPG